MIKTKNGYTKIRAKNKEELKRDLVEILISLIEDDMLTEDELNVCINCSKSLKKLYNGEPQIII